MNSYGVVGNPIQHSLSPLIHHLFAEQTNQTLCYQRILAPRNRLEYVLNQFQAQGGKGLNITLPFKQQAFQLVDRLSERACFTSSINTIRFNEDGSRFGDNTDGVGLIRDLALHHDLSLTNKRILLLGAGGAVRGVLHAILQEQPEEVVIVNRTESKAIELVKTVTVCSRVRICALHALKELRFDVVINGTSASLMGDVIRLPKTCLQNAFCYEMVYGKGETPFLRAAVDAGAAYCSDGLGMLIEQAAESFFIWHGIKPDTLPVYCRLFEKLNPSLYSG